MEQITVKHPDGTTLDLNSYTNISAVSSATLKSEFQGTDSIEIKVKSATPLDFYIGDSITYLGAKYTINQTPKIQKKGTRDLEYTLTFEGLQYELIDRVFLLSDIEDTPRTSLTGTLKAFMEEIIANASRESEYTWSYDIQSVGIGEDEVKTETFEENNCLEVLQQLMEDFECEFRITASETNKTRKITIAEDGALAEESLAGYVFEYGQAGGAYELKREPADNTNIITRLFVYGSSDNINTAENGESKMYRNTRLCLPEKNKATSYIQDEELIDLFGLKEGIMTFDDVKPLCKGVVQSVTNENGATTFKAYKYASNAGYGTEYDIDFDINDYLIPDTDASIVFQTGELAGYEFDLNGTDNFVDNGDNTITIKINAFYDENGMRFPYDGSSEAFNIKAGDEFNFNNIYFPLSRIESAEVELEEKAQEQFDETSIPQIKYSLTVDPIWLMKREDPERTGVLSDPFTVGNTVHVKDTALDLDDSIRINSLTRDLLEDWKFTLTLADKTTPTLVTKIISAMKLQDQIIKINDLTDSTKARRNWMTMQQVYDMVFDTEGNYYSEKIAPLSIETTMLSVGARSQQFTLQGILFEVNYNQDCNSVYNCAGTLEHFTIDDNYIITWNIAQRTQSGLNSGTAYYVYARCPKNYDKSGGVNTGGEIFYSATSYTFEGKDADGQTLDADNYYFLVGTLTTAYTDTGNSQYPTRDLALTYGSTTINGRFIRTGRITASTGNTYFDLDTGEICGTITFTSGGSTAESLINNAQDTANSAVSDAQGAYNEAISAQKDASQAIADAQGAYNEAISAQKDASQAIADAQEAYNEAISAQKDISNEITERRSLSDSIAYIKTALPDSSNTTTISGGVTLGNFIGVTANQSKTSGTEYYSVEKKVSVGTSAYVAESLFFFGFDAWTSGTVSFNISYVLSNISAGGASIIVRDGDETNIYNSGSRWDGSYSTGTINISVTTGMKLNFYAIVFIGTIEISPFMLTFNYTVVADENAVVAGMSNGDVSFFAGSYGLDYPQSAKFSVTSAGHVKMTDVELSTGEPGEQIILGSGVLKLAQSEKSMTVSAERFSTLEKAGLASATTQSESGSLTWSPTSFSKSSVDIMDVGGSHQSGTTISLNGTGSETVQTTDSVSASLSTGTGLFSDGSATGAITISSGNIYISSTEVTFSSSGNNVNFTNANATPGSARATVSDTVVIYINGVRATTKSHSASSATMLMPLTEASGSTSTIPRYSLSSTIGSWSISLADVSATGTFSSCQVTASLTRTITYYVSTPVGYVLSTGAAEVAMYASSTSSTVATYASGNASTAGTVSWGFIKTVVEYTSKLFSNGLIFQGDSTAQQFGVMPTADLGFIASNGNGCALKVDKVSTAWAMRGSSANTYSLYGNGYGLQATTDLATGTDWMDLFPTLAIHVYVPANLSNVFQYSPHGFFFSSTVELTSNTYTLTWNNITLNSSGWSTFHWIVSPYSSGIVASVQGTQTGVTVTIVNTSGSATTSAFYLAGFISLPHYITKD